MSTTMQHVQPTPTASRKPVTPKAKPRRQQPRNTVPAAGPGVNSESKTSLKSTPVTTTTTTTTTTPMVETQKVVKKKWKGHSKNKKSKSTPTLSPVTADSANHGAATSTTTPHVSQKLEPANQVPPTQVLPQLPPTVITKVSKTNPERSPTTTTTTKDDKDHDAKEAAKRERKKVLKARQQAEKKIRQEEHYNLVFSATQATITVLRKHGISCAVFGSLACKLYGSPRYPKDVDLLVLEPPSSTRTAEDIKSLILNTDPRHFYLKLPRDPEAIYRILYYREEYLGLDCKVDILLPGTLHLPYILSTPVISNHPTTPTPRDYITTISGIPLLPFSLLLVHKLQGWSDHRHAPEEFKQRKQDQDAGDLRRLFAMEDAIEVLRGTQPWTDSNLFSEEFQQLTRERVKEFCTVFPKRAEPWQLLGFDTTSSDVEL